ncbi:hypothetical protein [Kitasatospora sp. CB02891]|uniref:hypothetical protein n=1 Tax=Kitasatospora sp. CB02891 TaxID=2020329 RepID=UPI000C27BAC1|nr:hypothetical protein [Kitasatospora sp. CB02891]PJN24061.1 hypothetical protein CG736_19385 [Kitasatospora sp. CB02891]
MSADVTGLEALTADLARSAADVDRRAQQVVSKGALNIKNDWRANAAATAGRHARLYPMSIGYDLTAVPGIGVSAEIGPDKSKAQGPLGNLLEFGSVKNAPHNDGGRALAAEMPRFTAAVEALGEELL